MTEVMSKMPVVSSLYQTSRYVMHAHTDARGLTKNLSYWHFVSMPDPTTSVCLKSGRQRHARAEAHRRTHKICRQVKEVVVDHYNT